MKIKAIVKIEYNFDIEIPGPTTIIDLHARIRDEWAEIIFQGKTADYFVRQEFDFTADEMGKVENG